MAEPTGYEKSRSELLNEAVKASLLVNGGGSAALLAFVQSVWLVNTPLRNAAVVTMLCMVTALFMSLLVPLLRVAHSKKAAGQEGVVTAHWVGYMFCIYASVILFFIGAVYLALVALSLP